MRFLSVVIVAVTSVRLIDEHPLWHNLEAEWIESLIRVSDSKSHDLLTVISGKFGVYSTKMAIGGYLVPLPSLRRQTDAIGTGCEDYPAFKLVKWKAKAYRKRGTSSFIFPIP